MKKRNLKRCSENPKKSRAEKATKIRGLIPQNDMFIKHLFSEHSDVILQSVETSEKESAMSTKPKRVALYCRVSTGGQTIENQLLELQAIAERQGWDIVAVFKDEAISGSKGRDKRPGFDELCKAVTRKEFDMVAAWAVDRLGRSLVDLLAFLQELHSKDLGLYLHMQGLDTTTPNGRAMFQMLGVFAEFERSMIQERVKAGLSRAKAEGKKLGRPKVSQKMELAIVEAKASGKGIRKIAGELGTSPATVIRVLDDAGVEREKRKA
jgi:DNA invertase Pin-like site-specific DNA recombinase